MRRARTRAAPRVGEHRRAHRTVRSSCFNTGGCNANCCARDPDRRGDFIAHAFLWINGATEAEDLERGGLGAHVACRPGLRIPGALDGFEAAFRVLLGGRAGLLAEPFDTGALGVPHRSAEVLVSLARALAGARLWLEPGSDVAAAHRALLRIDGVGERLATRIVMHALHWPDAFDPSDRAIQRAAGAASPAELRQRAERWRPWRAYAALHLRLGPAT